MERKRTADGWTSKSYAIPGLAQNPLLTYNFQSIGRLDQFLSREWEDIKDFLEEEAYLLRFDHFSFLSSLWVMAGYEVLRILKALDTKEETRIAYEKFRRVRIPMVKFEVPKTHGKLDYPTDFGIIYPAITSTTKQPGWEIAPGVVVTRDELADTLYNLYHHPFEDLGD